MADAKTVLEFAKTNGAKILDLRFTDLPGLWQHVSYPIDQLSEDSLKKALEWMVPPSAVGPAINESDMLLIPTPTLTAWTRLPRRPPW